MSHINPKDPDLLNDDDVDYSSFSCCGDEDLVFLKCPSCGHIWVECFECSTWYVNLDDLGQRESSYLGSDEQRVQCPSCGKPFEDLHYLSNDACDRYLPTKKQVIAAGFGRFLSEKLRNSIDNEQPVAGAATEQKRAVQQVRIRVGSNFASVVGATLGAAGWIIGMAIALFLKGFQLDAWGTLLCSSGVLAVGYLIIRWTTRGRLVTLFHAVILLLAASFACGLIAVLILHARGSLEPIMDPDQKFPYLLNFAAPMVVLLMIGVAFLPPIRKFFSRHFV